MVTVLIPTHFNKDGLVEPPLATFNVVELIVQIPKVLSVSHSKLGGKVTNEIH